MKLAAACAVALVAVSAASAVYKPSPLLPLDGAYRTTDGRVVSLAVSEGSLLYTDFSTGDLRQLRATGPSRFSFGPAYLVQRPVGGTIRISGMKLAITTGGRTSAGTRIRVTRQRVAFRGAGVRIVGKVTSPATAGRHPAVAIVHGSEPGNRDGYDMLVNFYSSLGYVVLSYDKRGIGDSTGFYIERATAANIDSLAGDAVAALRVLAARKDVDPARLGLVGGSQAGWIPRAAAKSPLVRFAVIVSGPAMSVGEEEAYANFTAHGAVEPPPSDDAIRKFLDGIAPSGFEPRPDLERLSIPTLWLFGREDKSVYTPQSVAILESLPTKPTIRVFPAAGHYVLDTPHDLKSELPHAHRWQTGFFTTIANWLTALGH